MMIEPLFLRAEEVAELTGINNGKAGLSKGQRQTDWLRRNGIAHKVNARGFPVVYRSQFSSTPVLKEEKRWESAMLRAA